MNFDHEERRRGCRLGAVAGHAAIRICTLLLAAPVVFPTSVAGQAVLVNQDSLPQEERVLRSWQLTLTPAAEPRPALLYQLRVPYRMLKPGNATPHYYRALLMDAELPAKVKEQYVDRYQHWDASSEAIREEMRTWLNGHRNIYKELLAATYCETLDWDLRLRDLEGMATIEFLLPDAQRMRELARMLQVKVRLDVAEGRLDEALESLRVGFRLAVAVAETPTIINDLVGIAIASMMAHEMTELMARPDTPNLYWALASLDHPLIDMQAALDWENRVPWKIFNYLNDAETAVRSSEEWRRLVLDTYASFNRLTGDYQGKPEAISELAAAGLLLKNYPLAKRALIEDGMSAEQVEKMSVGQVVSIQTSRHLQHAYDESRKWTLLESGNIYQRLRDAEQRLREDSRSTTGPAAGAIPIANLLAPSVSQAWFASVRLERELAALRTIEAVRIHAAAHNGSLPRSLNDIETVAVPLDPLSNEPLSYQVQGDTAVLELVPRDKAFRHTDVIRYEIRIKKQHGNTNNKEF